jgi:hypothetical protein
MATLEEALIAHDMPSSFFHDDAKHEAGDDDSDQSEHAERQLQQRGRRVAVRQRHHFHGFPARGLGAGFFFGRFFVVQ